MQHSKIIIGALTMALLAGATHAQAQTVLPDPEPPTVVAPPKILSVSLPPNARLRFDLDAQDEDVLGVVKSLLKGFNGSSFKEMLRSTAPVSAPNGATSPSGESAVLQTLSDADLGTMLQNVHHLRVVAFETPYNYGNRRAQITQSQSVLNYYSAAYLTREGGRRVMRADFDDVQMLGVGFPDKGFAMVFQAPGFGMIMRADGYPNLESVGPLAMTAMLFGIRGNTSRITMIP